MKFKDWPLPFEEMFHNYGKLAEYDYPARAKNGESNGLMILLDVEKFNNGYYKAEGTGVKVAVHDHRDLPSMQLDSKLFSPGSYRQVNNLFSDNPLDNPLHTPLDAPLDPPSEAPLDPHLEAPLNNFLDTLLDTF